MKHKVIAFFAIVAVCALVVAPYAEARSPFGMPRMGGGRSGGLGLPGLSRGTAPLADAAGLSRGFGSMGNRSGFGGFPGLGMPSMPRFGNDHYSMSKAVRDVGIAHAVVGLVGIMANAAQAERCVAVPAGHWERRAVVVQPERYEQYQEWIPELYDSRTGVKIGGGYYETRSRLVPQVVQYQDVWVTP